MLSNSQEKMKSQSPIAIQKSNGADNQTQWILCVKTLSPDGIDTLGLLLLLRN